MKPSSSEEESRALIDLFSYGCKPGNGNYNDLKTKCNNCTHIRSIPGSCHVLCSKVDLSIEGSRHGIKNGWFMYPFNFDPIWRTNECKNYEPIDE